MTTTTGPHRTRWGTTVTDVATTFAGGTVTLHLSPPYAWNTAELELGAWSTAGGNDPADTAIAVTALVQGF